MHSIGDDFLGTSAPDVLQTDDASAQSTELPHRRVRVPQLLAAQLQGIWADAVADALEYIRDAVKRRDHDSIAARIQHLLTLASEVLGDNRGGSGQQRRAAPRVRDLRKRARAASTRAGATRSDNTRGKTATFEEHALAGRIHPATSATATTGVRPDALTAAAWRWSTIPQWRYSRRSTYQRLPRFPPQSRRAPPARPRWTLTGSLASSSACRKAQHWASVAGRTSTFGRRDCTARGQGTQ